jgi:hypothetical protein
VKRLRLFSVMLMLTLASIIPSVSTAATSGFTGGYEPQHWTAAGPGSTSITPSSGATTSVTLGYNFDPSDLGTNSWTYAVTAVDDGMASFDWNYSGFHSFYYVTAGLQIFADGPSGRVTQTLVSAGPAFCGACDPPSGGFNYSGTASIEVHQGFAFGVIASGGHFDGTRVLRGAVTLTNFEVVDRTPPTITPNVSGTLGTNGWYTSNVQVSWTVVDNESAITNTTGCDATTISSDTAGTTLTCSATSEGGTASQSVIIKRDATKPTLSPSVSPNPVLLNGSATASPNANDALSGVASQSCGAIDTSSVGTKTVSCTATDNAGNTDTASASYRVSYQFVGFANPIDGNSVLNLAKAGQAIPLKWRLLDATNAPVTTLSNVSVTATSLSCSAGTTLDAIEEYATGASGLQNLGNGYYQWNWKTPSSYANSCKTLQLNLGDGGTYTALFQFKK